MGTRSPLPGTGAIIAMSVTGMPRPAPIAARRRLTAGAAVFRSAQAVPGASASTDASSAATASPALFTLSTRPAPATASASLPAGVTPAGAGTFGS